MTEDTPGSRPTLPAPQPRAATQPSQAEASSNISGPRSSSGEKVDPERRVSSDIAKRAHQVRTALGKAALWGIQQLPLTTRRHLLFLFYQRRLGNFRSPRTFSEKMNWRILHDRRSELAWTCDKLAMKERAWRLGVKYPLTYWHGDNLEDLRGVWLPKEWVLKPNHRSGLVYFGSGEPDISALQALTAGWLGESQWRRMGEWAYSVARPTLLVEERLSEITDYKIRVSHGNVVACAVISDRFSSKKSLTFYSPSWEVIRATQAFPPGEYRPPPLVLTGLLDAARKMAGDLDFLRVDLYVVGDEVYLGEVTPYPAGGLNPIKPYAVDLSWGNLWTLPSLAPRPSAEMPTHPDDRK